MILTAHTAVGTAVGLVTRNPILGFFAGFFSHFILDAIPHSDLGSFGGDVGNFKKIKSWGLVIFGDIILSATFFFLIFYKTNFLPAVFWGTFGGVLPDLIDNNPLWSSALRIIFPTNYFHMFHEAIHFTIKKKKYFWVGVATQIAVIIISIAYVLAV